MHTDFKKIMRVSSVTVRLCHCIIASSVKNYFNMLKRQKTKKLPQEEK